MEIHFVNEEEKVDFDKFSSNLHDMLWLREQEKKGSKANKNNRDFDLLPIHVKNPFSKDNR